MSNLRVNGLHECDACGFTHADLLAICPYCGGTKCEQCDMGDDVPCAACEGSGDEL